MTIEVMNFAANALRKTKRNRRPVPALSIDLCVCGLARRCSGGLVKVCKQLGGGIGQYANIRADGDEGGAKFEIPLGERLVGREDAGRLAMALDAFQRVLDRCLYFRRAR